ncbi:aldehyde ferredoxin oxidoreductase N-terminal domain-containing protein [Desulfobacterales bacterium HSG17]|nr:aldehyde ferredoxin oxidoreductase N-terminal domain-containing protein [Desulfobacterales bacterium HSG17]
MTANQYGWCGRILRVDLSNSEISELDTNAYAEKFLGGRGIATRLYWEAVMPETGAFDPENHLIFMTGPLGATGAQGASRFIVAGKSPMLMPEGFCYGNLGGFFGPYLKRAGYDGLIITGKSEKKVYLSIQDNKAFLLSADNLWGKGVYEVRDALKEIHGTGVRFITTGIAGENLCRSANIMTDNEGSATGGFGAVFGSKNLKAVAVTGSGAPLVANTEALKKLNRETIHLNKRDPMFLPFSPDQVKRTGKSSCYQCGLDCMYRNAMRTASGKDMVRKCQAMFVYFPWTARTGESAETALNATGICNDLSICTMEMYNIIHWISAGFESGYLTQEQTGLDISKLGTSEFFETLANMIALRQGFGDILANGLLRAGEILGDQAKTLFAPEVSGVGDGATYSAREYMMNGLLYAFEPRQPIAMLHEISRLTGLWVMNQANPKSSPVTNDVFRGVAARFWGHEKAWDLMTHEGKAQAAVNIMNRTYVKDSLLLCDSCWPLMVSWNTPDFAGDPTLESKTFSAVTGIEMDEAGLNKYGERIFNLERAILLREGRKPKTDDIIAEYNYTKPVQTVLMNPEVIIPGPGNEVLSRKGCTIERKAFEQMREEFYTLRGWDPETGMQTKETLERLELIDIL